MENYVDVLKFKATKKNYQITSIFFHTQAVALCSSVNLQANDKRQC